MGKFNWVKILSITAVVIAVIGGLYYYSSYYLKGGGDFSEISVKLRESGEIVFDMANVLQVKLPQSFLGLEEKEIAGDFSGASEMLNGSLVIMDELSQKNEFLKEKTKEFKSTDQNLADKSAREPVDKTSDILSRLILSFEEIIGLERQLLNMAKAYYDELSVNESTKAPDFLQINAKIAISSNNLSNLLGDFGIAANDLNTLINGEPAVKFSDGQEPKTETRELKIEDVALGQGEEAKNGDTLVVHYVGTLENGTKFDSSVDRDQPFIFVLGQGQVIRGWEQGLLGIKIGGHRRLTIPPELGYGARGQGAIPPNSTLIFEIDLLDIK